ncbi:MAG TPA: hypothetical protein VE974_20340 [Thermoanaerobaculia bacterium]|nr:hypothetical protein [Thermoanaerobaculia bacterium]
MPILRKKTDATYLRLQDAFDELEPVRGQRVSTPPFSEQLSIAVNACRSGPLGYDVDPALLMLSRGFVEQIREAIEQKNVDTVLVVAYPDARDLKRLSRTHGLHPNMPATAFLVQHLVGRGYHIQAPDVLGRYTSLPQIRAALCQGKQGLPELFTNHHRSLDQVVGHAYVVFTSSAAVAPIRPRGESYSAAATKYDLPTIDEMLVLCGVMGIPSDTTTYPAHYTGEWLAAGCNGEPAYAKSDARRFGVYVADPDGAPVITRARPVLRWLPGTQ